MKMCRNVNFVLKFSDSALKIQHCIWAAEAHGVKISPQDFIHPDDQAALENLKAVPLFPQAVKLFMKTVTEQQLHGMYMAGKIRLGPDQLPEYYRYLPPICKKLEIEEPEFYLEMDPSPNAYTVGDSRVFITVTSGLLEYLSEEEIKAVIAHECGHIVCRHVLYHTMAVFLSRMGPGFFGLSEIVVKPLQLALSYWSRRSELSADRAAAVVMGDSRPLVETMVRLAGGPKAITGNINLEAWLKQAEAYDQLNKSDWDKVLQSLAVMNNDHPFPAVRSREITKWCETDAFKRLCGTVKKLSTSPKCPKCGSMVEKQWKFCQDCGQLLANDKS
jgi:Zn-dependent protease with chaperone function